MQSINALQELRDNELCIVTTLYGEREVRWSSSNWCFYDLESDIKIDTEIIEWRPASIKF